MKIAFTEPAEGEKYVIEKNAARRLVRLLSPELPLLGFQTMRGPKMSADLTYLATYSSQYLRILSVREDLLTEGLRVAFREEAVPQICRGINHHRKSSFSWPFVAVALDGAIYEAICSEGALFPSRPEVIRYIRKHHNQICRFGSAPAASGLRRT